MFPPMRDRESLHSPLHLEPLPCEGPWEGKIAYLDRDGVIIRGFESYVNDTSEVFVLENAANSIGELRRNGFRICIVTNQSPIGRGLWSRENLALIHDKMREELLLSDPDAILDLTLHSSYAPWHNSWARKPNPGMLEAGRQILDAADAGKSLRETDIKFGDNWKDRPSELDSVMVGDRNVDIMAASAHGVRSFRCNPDVGISEVISKILEN